MSCEFADPDVCEVGRMMNSIGAIYGPENNVSDFRLCFESLDLDGAGHAVYNKGECVRVDIPAPDEYTFSSHPAEISRWLLVKGNDKSWACYTSKTRVAPSLSDTPVTSQITLTDHVLRKFANFIDNSQKTLHEEVVESTKQQKVRKVSNGIKVLQVFAGEILMGTASRFFMNSHSNKSDA